ncbi:nuclear transport factor 2 family protein [Nocardia neocaledoniensis]|uniref:nuclear transport factor 2 family protein n=1 Tax=Nocardia neocaledoniensis TaxID=236511 RepID=UPI0024571EB2|nr:nuclear transport factor 2 family protein [Nocardia neocaledoniensis]
MSKDNAILSSRSARLYYRYARAIDEGDLAAIRAMVTDDVKITRGDRPTEEGVEALLDVCRAHNARAVPVSRHMVTNVLAESVGHEIVTHAYFQASFFETERTLLITGVYDDVHVEDGNELKIAHKRIRVHRVLQLPAAEVAMPQWPGSGSDATGTS